MHQSGLFSPFLKRKWEEARSSWSQRASIPWDCACCELAVLRFPRQQFHPARRGVPNCWDRRRAVSAPLSFFPYSRALQPLAAGPHRPAGTQPAEPSLVRRPWRRLLQLGGLGAGLRGRVLEAAVESGLLIFGGTSNRFHASGVSCQ